MPLFVREGAILVRLPDGVETLVARHAGMNDSVQAMDDRRVLEVWPGEKGSVRTWDGIEATLTMVGDAAELRLASRTPRPVELRVVHRPLSRVTIGGRRAVTRSGPNRQTVLMIPRLREEVLVRWIEGEGQ